MTSNGKQSSGSEMSEEQYRTLCKQLRAEQMRRGKGKKKNKPLLIPIGDVNSIQKTIKIQKSPIEWDYLKIGYLFSLDLEGTVLYTKTGKERAICLNTFSPVPVGGASVYRVFL